ncbi:MAG: hypothetical protein ACON42_07040 [Flavobacteriaceae bacterium]
MNLNRVIGGLSLLLFHNCTPIAEEIVDTTSPITLRERLPAVVRQNEDSFTWHDTNGSNVSSRVKFQLLSNIVLDSIVWVFPGANPDRVDGALQAQTDFQGYGTFRPYVALTQIDSTSSSRTRIIRDTLYADPVNVNYTENDWNSYLRIGPDVWENFGPSNILIGRDTLVDQMADSLMISKRFEGLNGRDAKLKFSFKITKNLPAQAGTGSAKKFSILIDDFERFDVRDVGNDRFYNTTITLRRKQQFDLSIVRYPSLYLTNWSVSTTSPTSIDANSLQVYQPSEDPNTLIGYPKVLADSTYVQLAFGNYRFGIDPSGSRLIENGTPILLLGEDENGDGNYQRQYKLVVSLERGLPARFRLFQDVNYSDNEERFDVFIDDFRLEFD